VSSVTPSAANITVAPITGSEQSVPGNPDVSVTWSSASNGDSADLWYAPAGQTPSTYVNPTLTGTTTIRGVTSVTGLTQNTSTDPQQVATLTGTTTTNYGNPTVGFTWTSTGTGGDFNYKLSTAGTYTHVNPTLSGSVFSAQMGSLPAGTYNFTWDAYHTNNKVGQVTNAAGSGTFTVANGVATLTS
jgi:hypothetical protein